MRPLYAPSPQAMLITELKKHTILLSNSSGNGFSGGNSGGAEGQPPPPPPPFVNRHSLSEMSVLSEFSKQLNIQKIIKIITGVGGNSYVLNVDLIIVKLFV